jgi:acyl-CoA dehydrogenase
MFDFSRLMPDSKGADFYTADLDLAFLLKRSLSKEQYEQAQDTLCDLGLLASRRIDQLAEDANRHTPELVQFDKRGQRVDKVIFHPAYHELEEIAYEQFAIAACTHRSDALGWSERIPQPLKFAMAYLAMQAEAGVFCPVSMTDALARVLEKHASEALKRRFLPGLIAMNMAELKQGAMFLTEKQGGSDVGQTATVAKRSRELDPLSGIGLQPEWELWGDKWFCSNVSADLILTLARPEGAVSGTRGLGLFLVPRLLEDGKHNRYVIHRLKDKLGTRSMASGEVTLQGALAYQVGDLGRGFVHMTEMINLTRVWAAIGSLAAMRRSFFEALLHTRERIAFGRPLAEQPLMRRQLIELLVEVEGCAALVFETTVVLERVDRYESEVDRRLLRILTPLAKYYVPKQAEYVALEALEMRGGNGYIEDWPNARLLRDCIVNAIWEGSSNVIALDVLRAMEREGADRSLFEMLQSRLQGLVQPVVQPLVRQVQAQAETLAGRVRHLLALGNEQAQLPMRGIVERMAQLTILTLLLEQAESEILRGPSGTGRRKLIVAQLFFQRHVQVHHDGYAADDDTTALDYFAALVGWGALPVDGGD